MNKNCNARARRPFHKYYSLATMLTDEVQKRIFYVLKNYSFSEFWLNRF